MRRPRNIIFLILALIIAAIFHFAKTFASEDARDNAEANPAPPSAETSTPSAAPAPTESKVLTVFSWNMLNYGDKKKTKLAELSSEKNIDVIERMGKLFKNADLLAFQEVNAKDFRFALAYLREELQKSDPDEVLCLGFSDLTAVRPKEAERFAFVWKDSRIHYVTTAGKEIPCSDNPDLFINTPLLISVGDNMGRMPTFGTFLFRPSGQKFYYVNLHLLPTHKKPQLELPVLSQAFTHTLRNPTSADLAFLRSGKTPIIISGDFNLSSKHAAFQNLRDAGFTAVLNGEKTSLHRKKRELNQAYDNFWYRSGSDVKLKATYSKVHNLYDLFPELDTKEVYTHISDHSPIEARFEFSN